jgi:hypothetical protein
MRIVKAFLLGVLGTLLLAAAGCGAAGTSGATTELARVRTSTRCPSAPSLDARTASPTTLVPDTPKRALICRYNPPSLGRPHSGFSLAGARWTASSNRVERLAHLLNELPPIANPAPSCPVFGGRTDLIVFLYANRRPARVRVKRSGCTPVSNGRVTRYGLGLPVRESAHWPDEGLL